MFGSKIFLFYFYIHADLWTELNTMTCSHCLFVCCCRQ